MYLFCFCKEKSNFYFLCFRNNLSHQLQLAIARADSESLARSIAEETIADLEKERTMKELELKEVISRHRAEISNKDNLISNVSFCWY